MSCFLSLFSQFWMIETLWALSGAIIVYFNHYLCLWLWCSSCCLMCFCASLFEREEKNRSEKQIWVLLKVMMANLKYKDWELVIWSCHVTELYLFFSSINLFSLMPVHKYLSNTRGFYYWLQSNICNRIDGLKKERMNSIVNFGYFNLF